MPVGGKKRSGSKEEIAVRGTPRPSGLLKFLNIVRGKTEETRPARDGDRGLGRKERTGENVSKFGGASDAG